MGVERLELAVEVDPVVRRVDEPVQPLALVLVGHGRHDPDAVLGRQGRQRDPRLGDDLVEVELVAVEHHLGHLDGRCVEEGRGARLRARERQLRLDAEHLVAPRQVEVDGRVDIGDEGRAGDGLVTGEVLGGHRGSGLVRARPRLRPRRPAVVAVGGAGTATDRCHAGAIVHVSGGRLRRDGVPPARGDHEESTGACRSTPRPVRSTSPSPRRSRPACSRPTSSTRPGRRSRRGSATRSRPSRRRPSSTRSSRSPPASWGSASRRATASASCRAPATSGRCSTTRSGPPAASPCRSTRPARPSRSTGSSRTRGRRPSSSRTTSCSAATRRSPTERPPASTRSSSRAARSSSSRGTPVRRPPRTSGSARPTGPAPTSPRSSTPPARPGARRA